jgi:hypothetical protein
MNVKARCPKSRRHKRFTTTAHVMQEWEVDDVGEFLKVVADMDTDAGPDPYNLWTCSICGAAATVTRT